MTPIGVTSQSPLLGGGGGQPFSDLIPDGARICAIYLRHGQYIDGIRISWTTADGTRVDGPYHGGQGGAEASVEIAAGGMAWPSQIWSGDYVDGLAFDISNGDYFGRFGGMGGQARYNEAIIPPPLPIHEPYFKRVTGSLLGIYGRSGDVLDALGFWYRYDEIWND